MVPETIGSCPIIRVVSMARRNTQLRPVATTAITGQVTCPVGVTYQELPEIFSGKLPYVQEVVWVSPLAINETRYRIWK